MPYSPEQIKKHIQILDDKELEENPEEPEFTQLIRIVHSE